MMLILLHNKIIGYILLILLSGLVFWEIRKVQCWLKPLLWHTFVIYIYIYQENTNANNRNFLKFTKITRLVWIEIIYDEQTIADIWHCSVLTHAPLHIPLLTEMNDMGMDIVFACFQTWNLLYVVNIFPCSLPLKLMSMLTTVSPWSCDPWISPIRAWYFTNRSFIIINLGTIVFVRYFELSSCPAGSVVNTLTSHQCGLGSIPGINIWDGGEVASTSKWLFSWYPIFFPQ